MTTESQKKKQRLYSPDRENRVAAALRENLRKRKMKQEVSSALKSNTVKE